MALDESKDNDEVVEQDDLTFLVEKGLMTNCGDIKVDFMDAGPRSGFSISSKMPLGGGASGCGSCGGSCG